ncbi:uncharacterized protein LACBIDRAFT_295786 [Laccaria bicolor S238N-H82]|uniref:Predicted protein n=1 Tax=Laccaria bicolor (strain S238N-H82 / ATCC MYA-4686) TaxID=486041 RepID=B0DYB6_LACBS|nr:uncharacterized protein LACBIDRAFT_295786 [Laccaria bicolor S238N-H82]EDR00358.1 predicted protein [Laccaria bicolor S238N-H82]|eukprot:XP_001888917.1 predicted protein [Laccaria bicolor S238N-H82]
MSGYDYLDDCHALEVPPFHYGGSLCKGRLECIGNEPPESYPKYNVEPPNSTINFDCESDSDSGNPAIPNSTQSNSNSFVDDLVANFDSAGFTMEGSPIIQTFLSERETLGLYRFNGPFLVLEFGDINGVVQSTYMIPDLFKIKHSHRLMVSLISAQSRQFIAQQQLRHLPPGTTVDDAAKLQQDVVNLMLARARVEVEFLLPHATGSHTTV